MVDPEHVKGVFASYAKLRQGRVSREDAWQRVKVSADDFSEDDRKRLIALIRDWEIIEGHRYQASRSNDPHATMFKPPEGLREIREQLKAQHDQPTPSGEGSPISELAKQATTVPPVQVTDVTKKTTTRPVRLVNCPKCGTSNTFDAARCVECGTELPQTQEIDPTIISLARTEAEQTHVIRGMTLELKFPATSQTLRVVISRDRLVVGRTSGPGLMTPDIDLTPYDAQRKGVSRYHASLRCEGDTLVINDLESLNHTYINDLRLYPHEARVLRDGDVLKLGQLVIHVSFIAQQTG